MTMKIMTQINKKYNMKQLKKILKEQHVSSTITDAREELKQKGANDELITAIESWTKDEWNKIKRTRSNWHYGKYVGSPGANPNSSYNVYVQDIQKYRNVYNSEQSTSIGESYLPANNTSISLKRLIAEQDKLDNNWSPAAINKTMKWILKLNENYEFDYVNAFSNTEDRNNRTNKIRIIKDGSEPKLASVWLEVAKQLVWKQHEKVEAEKVPPPKQPLPKTFEEAMDYLSNKSWFGSLRPATTKDVLLHGDNNIIYYMEDDGTRTHWADKFYDSDEWKKYIWDNAVNVGTVNNEWLKDFPLSTTTKKKVLRTPTSYDQATALMMAAVDHNHARGFSKGKSEMLRAVDMIKSSAEYTKVDNMIKDTHDLYKTTSYGTYEFFFFRSGKVYKKLWDAAEGEITGDKEKDYDILRAISPYTITWKNTGDWWHMERWAIIPDYLVRDSDFGWGSGFIGLLTGGSKVAGLSKNAQDEILIKLIRKGIFTYNEESNMAIDPNGKTVAFHSYHNELVDIESAPMPPESDPIEEE